MIGDIVAGIGGVLAVMVAIVAAVVRRVLYWTDQFRGFGERLARLEQRMEDWETRHED